MGVFSSFAKGGVKLLGKISPQVKATERYVATGAKDTIRGTGRVIKRNPLKTTMAVSGVGVGAYSVATNTSFGNNMLTALKAPLDMLTGGGFSELWGEIEPAFMMGVLVGGGMVLLKMDNGVMCIAAPAALELFLEKHDFGSSQLDPFHLVLNVAPAAAGGYLGCQVLSLVA